MSETPKKCPNCNEDIDLLKNRVITEQCGHIKCRLCFIREESGCVLCSQLQSTSSKENPVSHLFDDIKSTYTFAIDEQQSIDDIDSDTDELQINTDTSGSIESFEEYDRETEKESKDPTNQIPCNKKVEILENVLISSKDINPENHKLNTTVENNASISVESHPTTDSMPSHIVVNDKCSNNKLTYTCKLCQKTFKSKNNRKYHLYCDPDIPKPFPCSDCNKRFVTASHLEYHRKIHLDSNIFQCKFCDKRYLREISLKKHERKHKSKELVEFV